MLSAVENIPQLQIFNMEDIDTQARLDGGDVLHTGIRVRSEDVSHVTCYCSSAEMHCSVD